MLIKAIGTGIILSFIFTELTGLSAGGLIVPGYFAIFWNHPLRIVMTFIVAILSYSIVLLISNFVIIYSQRRFMTAVISSYILGYLISIYLIDFIPLAADIRVIGYIVPGLIANDMIKQGIIKTIISTLLVALIVKFTLILFL